MSSFKPYSIISLAMFSPIKYAVSSSGQKPHIFSSIMYCVRLIPHPKSVVSKSPCKNIHGQRNAIHFSVQANYEFQVNAAGTARQLSSVIDEQEEDGEKKAVQNENLVAFFQTKPLPAEQITTN
jgi:hypothetical protein